MSASAQASQFGYSGRNGTDGSSGRQGRDGQSAVITATGQSMILDLSGEDGDDASDGYNGEDATYCVQPNKPAENVYGANGGRGGDAGVGGSGGDGGTLTVYTSDRGNLRFISVRSEGGRGGREGRAGTGGRPCQCQYASWQATWCQKEKQSDGTWKDVCHTGTFYCTSGDYGRNGGTGSRGSDGYSGHLVLIPQLSALPDVNPQKVLTVSQLFDETFTLSDNIWLTRTGATALLAPGSRISDTFREFSHRQEYRASYAWEARRPVQDFGHLTAVLRASDNGIQLELPLGVWYQTREQVVSGGVRRTTFEKMLYEQDANQLRVAFSGAGRDFVATVFDDGQVSDLVTTRFDITLKNDGFFSDKKLYEGTMPADLIATGTNQFTLKLGRLPGVDPKKLKEGEKIIFQASVLRSLNPFSLTQKLDEKYKIPKP